MKKKCLDCSNQIDARSKRCYQCRASHAGSFKGKKHSKRTKKIIGTKSSAKFTDEYKQRIYRDKCAGNKKRTINGYILIKNYAHPNRNSHNDILEHILIASNTLGRPLKRGEVVHHINFIRDDNRKENLFVFDNNSLHISCHKSIFMLIDKLLKRRVIKFVEGSYRLV